MYLVYRAEVKISENCGFTRPYRHHGVMHDYRGKFNLKIKISFSRVVYVRNATELFL